MNNEKKHRDIKVEGNEKTIKGKLHVRIIFLYPRVRDIQTAARSIYYLSNVAICQHRSENTARI
jgi:hypothetical protein